MPIELDAVDRRLLARLQVDATLPIAELAESVNLSPSPCWRRIKRLEDAGVIKARVALLDPQRLGLDFTAYCTVKLAQPTPENLDGFEALVMTLPEVTECALVTGAADFELRVVTADITAFDAFLRDKVLSSGLVANIESRIVVRAVKNETALPL